MIERTSTQQQQLGFSWNKTREGTQQPVTDKQQHKRTSVMKRRRLNDNEICIHNRPGSRSVTLCKALSERIIVDDMQFVCIHYHENKVIMAFYKSNQRGNYARISYDQGQRSPNVTFYKKEFIKSLCEPFGLPEGNYYASLREYSYGNNAEWLMFEVEAIIERQPLSDTEGEKTCPNCGRTLPTSEFYTRDNGQGLQSWCKDCCRSHGRLRNGSTGEYRADPTISQATDEQLYEELKRRGYEGNMTRSIVKTLQ